MNVDYDSKNKRDYEQYMRDRDPDMTKQIEDEIAWQARTDLEAKKMLSKLLEEEMKEPDVDGEILDLNLRVDAMEKVLERLKEKLSALEMVQKGRPKIQKGDIVVTVDDPGFVYEELVDNKEDAELLNSDGHPSRLIVEIWRRKDEIGGPRTYILIFRTWSSRD
jgi:hypothetical protein